MKKAKIFAIANQKGGVGKTTTTVNLAASIAAFSKSVLLIDLDPQANATTGSGLNKFELSKTVCDVLLGQANVLDAVFTLEQAKYDILPANADLTTAEIELMQEDDRVTRLKEALSSLTNVYDFILIDCPPSLNILTINALVASDGIIVPLQCEFYALEGVSALMDTVEGVTEAANPKLVIEGVLRTMYDGRNNLATQVSEQLIEHFGDKVFKTVIPRNVRLAEAPSHGIPITYYDPSSRGAYAYMDLAAEILERLEI